MTRTIFSTLLIAIACLVPRASAAESSQPGVATAAGQADRPAEPDAQAGAAAATQPPKPGEAWRDLFDGKSLKDWEIVEKYDFKRHGKVYAKDGCLILDEGVPMTGVRYTGEFPKLDYEVTLEGQRLSGGDFFCGMTFPVGDEALTLILGGWGGWVVGLSLINGDFAVDNETCQAVEFANHRWYRVRLRVTAEEVQVWLDDDKLIDLAKEDRKYSLAWSTEPCLPFGFASYLTAGSLRKIRVRKIQPE